METDVTQSIHGGGILGCGHLQAREDCGRTSGVGEGPAEKGEDLREFGKVKLTGLGNLIDEGLGNNSLWTKSDSCLAS